MVDPDSPSPLALLAEAYRAKRTGLLTLGSPEAPLHVQLRDGQVHGMGPAAIFSSEPEPPLGRPDDSARIKLARVLEEIGLRAAATKPSSAPTASLGTLRERLVAALVDPSVAATFEPDAPVPPEVAEVAGATEPLILEAVRRIDGAEAVHAALGDVNRGLVATSALTTEERTLTLTEGYILSRIDGLSTAREVLQLVPLDPEETERTLLGLLLTGRVEYRPLPVSHSRRASTSAPALEGTAPAAEPSGEGAPAVEEPVPATPAPPDEPAAEAPPFESAAEAPEGEEAYPQAELADEEEPKAEAGPAPTALAPEVLARRREILEIFQSLPLKNHFEVLGVEPGCTDTDVKRAYAARVKRFHPDAQRDLQLEDLHDVLEAIFIRVGEAWEVLGEERSRLSYEARSGIVRRPREGTLSPPPTASTQTPSATPGSRSPSPAPSSSGTPVPDYVPPEETLVQAQLLLGQGRYWDAIQVLEAAVPQMEPRRQQNRGRILLARAYSKNPNWVRKAEEQLQDVVRADPNNLEALYQLGLIYKAGGLAARAQAMFKRVLELRPDHKEAAAQLGVRPGAGGLLKRIFGKGQAS